MFKHIPFREDSKVRIDPEKLNHILVISFPSIVMRQHRQLIDYFIRRLGGKLKKEVILEKYDWNKELYDPYES